MTRPDLLASLVRASAEMQACHVAATDAGKQDLVDAAHKLGEHIAMMIAQVAREQRK